MLGHIRRQPIGRIIANTRTLVYNMDRGIRASERVFHAVKKHIPDGKIKKKHFFTREIFFTSKPSSRSLSIPACDSNGFFPSFKARRRFEKLVAGNAPDAPDAPRGVNRF